MWLVIIGVILISGGWITLYQCTRENVPKEYRPWWAKDEENQTANEGQAIMGGVICVIGCILILVAISQFLTHFIHLY